jgi:hypothetical protein
MDLGVKEKLIPAGEVPTPAPEKKEPKTIYPSTDLRDKIADELRAAGVEVDSEGTATIHWRCSGDTQDQYSNRITLDLHSLDDLKVEDEDEDGEGQEPDEEEKVLGYKRSETKSEAPDTSAADNLED